MEENQFLTPIIEFVENFKVPLIVGLGGLALIIFGFVYTGSQEAKESSKLITSEQASSSAGSTIKVDVSGQVARAGVYELAEGSRVEDALKASGNFLPSADKTWIDKNLNLARVLSDGEKIYIPKVGETLAATTSEGSLININTSSGSELDTLPGIGKVTAEKIINGRPFSKIEDLKTRKIVSESTYEKIKGLVSVN